MSENGEICTAGKNFTLPPALTNSTSAFAMHSPSDLKDVTKWLPKEHQGVPK